MLKLTDDEIIYAKQLFDVRRKMKNWSIEETTQADRLLAILRGHGAGAAEGGGFLITRHIIDGQNEIVITENGMHPSEM